MQNAFFIMIRLNKYLIGIVFLLMTNRIVKGQGNTQNIKLNGYIETYYAYNSTKPIQQTSAPFLYSYNRNNELNVNLAFIKGQYQNDQLRMNIALATGTYMNANYGAEHGVFKNLYEANLGIKVSKKKDLWLDAGLMSAHLGFESAIGKDNHTLTRSLSAENSPYYETGLKLTYKSLNQHFNLSALVLNGWQCIERPKANSTPTFGHQLIYQPNTKITLNSSSFIGNIYPDSMRRMRYFHNLYGLFQIHKRCLITAGFDIGLEQQKKWFNKYNLWWVLTGIAQCKLSQNKFIAIRTEYFNDPNLVIVKSYAPQALKLWSNSINFDYHISSTVVWRIEGRVFNASNAIFNNKSQVVKNNLMFTTALCCYL